MKKLITLFITIVLSLTVFAGCELNFQTGTSGYTSTPDVSVKPTYETIDVHFNVVNDIPDSSQDSSSSDSGNTSSTEEPTPVEPPKGDLKTVLKTIGKTVVEVYGYKLDENTQAVVSTNVGSGVIIANNDDLTKSYIVTCHNIIEDVDGVDVKTFDGETYSAKFIGSDPDSNLCVMSIDEYFAPAIVYSGSEVEVGESVVAIGNTLGSLGISVTSGIVSAPDREIVIESKKKSLLQTDAAVGEGSSGGGLFTQTGFLIGIIDANYNEEFLKLLNGIGLAIPSSNMIEITSELMRTYTGEKPGYIEGKYNLGFVVNDYYSSKWTTQPYVYVMNLDPSGCLYKAGVKVNDRLVSIAYGENTYTVTDAKNFVEFLNTTTFKIGDTFTLNVIRNERALSVQVDILQYIYGIS